MSDFIAKEHIPAGDPGRGVLAHARGDRLSAERVKDNGWEDYVVGANTKEARQILADLTGEPAESDSKSTTASAAATSSNQKG